MKKKTVKLVSAVVVLGVACGAYVGVNSYVSSQEAKEAEEEDKSVDLISLKADDVTAVSFKADDADVGFDRKDDTWTEKSDADFPVNQDTVDNAVKGVTSLTADQEISDVEDLSQYDLDDPQNTITLTTADGDTTLQVGMESSNNQYYVKKADDDKNVFLVSSTSLEPFMGGLYDFAESGTFPSVTSATITDVKVDKEDGYELTQDADNLFWNVSDGKDTEKADTTKAGTVTSAIGSLAYDKFVDYNCTDDAKYGFDDPYAVVKVKYTEEAVESDEDTEDTTDADTEKSTTDTSEESTDADSDTAESADTSDTDSSEDEQETQTVEKTLTIYVGDETGDDRYVKVDDSKEVYTITKDSLTDILDSTAADFYSLSVNYVSVNDLDSLEIKSDDGDHTVDVVRETAKAEDEEESDTDTDTSDEENTDESSAETSDESSADVDSSDETTSDTTTTSYELDGEELDESAFTTFYNKLINMTAQERLTEEYTPDGEAAYTFLFKDTDGNETTAEYYEYDTNFYAAVVGDKVYLVNKMNVKELNDAYQDMINPDTEDESTEEN